MDSIILKIGFLKPMVFFRISITKRRSIQIHCAKWIPERNLSNSIYCLEDHYGVKSPQLTIFLAIITQVICNIWGSFREFFEVAWRMGSQDMVSVVNWTIWLCNKSPFNRSGNVLFPFQMAFSCLNGFYKWGSS